MHPDNSTTEILPLPLPEGRDARIVLVCIRRMAAHGMRDAHATYLMLDSFGTNFRRVLVMLRAFVVELARASNRTISIAPCCAMRMTKDEGLLLQALMAASCEPADTEQVLARLTNNTQIGGAMMTARYFSHTMQDMGRKL